LFPFAFVLVPVDVFAHALTFGFVNHPGAVVLQSTDISEQASSVALVIFPLPIVNIPVGTLMKAPAISDSLDCFSLVWSGEGPGSDSVCQVLLLTR
jgi:hypothetical protein